MITRDIRRLKNAKRGLRVAILNIGKLHGRMGDILLYRYDDLWNMTKELNDEISRLKNERRENEKMEEK